jgi:hypothetical protein
MRVLVETAMLLAFVYIIPLVAQTERSLIGTWKLVAVVASHSSGVRDSAPYGSQPTGFLTYTPEGRMMAIISYEGRKPLSVADRQAAPVRERAEAFGSFLAYAGRYTISGDTVVHHVEAASLQNWVGTALVRVVEVERDRIVLRTPQVSVGGRPRRFELTWKRLK